MRKDAVGGVGFRGFTDNRFAREPLAQFRKVTRQFFRAAEDGVQVITLSRMEFGCHIHPRIRMNSFGGA
jgi:hypothetical protein